MRSKLELIELKSTERVTIFQKITTFILLLYPILNIYKMPGLASTTIAYVVTALFGAIYFFNKFSVDSRLRNRNVPKYLLLYLGYALFSFIITGGGLLPIDLLIGFLYVFLFFENVNFSFFLKAYRLIGIICIAFFAIQEFMYNTTGSRPTGIIPGLTLVDSQVSTAQYIEVLSTYARSASFFREPAHFAQFLLPLLCLELFAPGKSLVRASVIAITLLYLRSGNAVIGLVIIAVVYVIQLFKGGMKFRQKIIVLIVTIAAAYGGMKFMQTEDGEELFSREEEVTDTQRMGSGFLRVYRGYWLYGDFNIFEKIIGMNNRAILDEHINNLPGWVFSYGQKDYLNGIQYLLVHTGLIGTIIFVLLYLSLWKRNDICGRSCIVICIGLSFIAAIHLSPFMFICLIVAKSRQNERLNSKRLETIKSYAQNI